MSEYVVHTLVDIATSIVGYIVFRVLVARYDDVLRKGYGAFLRYFAKAPKSDENRVEQIDYITLDALSAKAILIAILTPTMLGIAVYKACFSLYVHAGDSPVLTLVAFIANPLVVFLLLGVPLMKCIEAAIEAAQTQRVIVTDSSIEAGSQRIHKASINLPVFLKRDTFRVSVIATTAEGNRCLLRVPRPFGSFTKDRRPEECVAMLNSILQLPTVEMPR
jgi:hypothetical protein